MLEHLLNIAEAAGRETLRFYKREGLRIEDKEDGSPVTEADRASDALVVSALQGGWDIPIVSEERTLTPYDTRNTWQRYWVIDPIDGTRDFIAGNDDYCVCIALIEDGWPKLGVIHAPALATTWWAERGQGAHVRDAAGTRKLPDSIARTSTIGLESRSHPNEDVAAFFREHQVDEVRQRGAAIKYGLIGSGEADVYPAIRSSWEWDVAPGHLIVEEAGGTVRTIDGSEIRYNSESLHIPPFVARAARGAA